MIEGSAIDNGNREVSTSQKATCEKAAPKPVSHGASREGNSTEGNEDNVLDSAHSADSSNATVTDTEAQKEQDRNALAQPENNTRTRPSTPSRQRSRSRSGRGTKAFEKTKLEHWDITVRQRAHAAALKAYEGCDEDLELHQIQAHIDYMCDKGSLDYTSHATLRKIRTRCIKAMEAKNRGLPWADKLPKREEVMAAKFCHKKESLPPSYVNMLADLDSEDLCENPTPAIDAQNREPEDEAPATANIHDAMKRFGDNLVQISTRVRAVETGIRVGEPNMPHLIAEQNNIKAQLKAYQDWSNGVETRLSELEQENRKILRLLSAQRTDQENAEKGKNAEQEKTAQYEEDAEYEEDLGNIYDA